MKVTPTVYPEVYPSDMPPILTRLEPSVCRAFINLKTPSRSPQLSYGTPSACANRAAYLMPILLEMVRSELLAPAATSERDQAELVAYLSRPFAKKLDVEAQALSLIHI